MGLRVNDVFVGIITGVIAAVFAALFEGAIAALRLFTFGHLGGAVGSNLIWIALFGAIVGGLVGWVFGTFVKPRERTR